MGNKRYKVLKNTIIENTTGNTIVFSISKDAQFMNELCGRLNGGCGFNGFTPTFILNATKEEILNVEKDRDSKSIQRTD